MSTNNKGKRFKSEIQQSETIEDVQPVEEKLMTIDEIAAQEEFINEVPEIEDIPPQGVPFDEEFEKTFTELTEVPVTLIEVEEEKLEETKENVFAFQKDYFFVNDGKSAQIDVLPSDPPVVSTPLVVEPLQVQKPQRKTLAQLTACELNIYHKTGILPLL